MKKSALILTSLLAAVLCTAGCSSSKKEKNMKTASIVLNGNPTTGYTWTSTVEDESICSVEEKVEYLGKDGMVGAPSKFTYTVKPLKAGTTKITFEYKRPWENNPAEETESYTVTVDEKLNVKVE